DGIRDRNVTGVQTCALPILARDSDKCVAKHLAAEEGWVEDADRHSRSTGGAPGYIQQRSWSEGHDEDCKKRPPLDPPLDSAVDCPVFQHPAPAKAGRVTGKFPERLGEAGDQTDGEGRR